MAAAADQSMAIQLNNSGVRALNAGDYRSAIQIFEEALKVDPAYSMARDNLAIACSGYGLKLRGTPKEALKQFHRALSLNPSNPTTLQNIYGLIKINGKRSSIIPGSR